MDYFPKSRITFLFIILLGIWIDVSVRAEQNRAWRKKRRFTVAQKHYYEGNSIFPTIRYCEKSEDILIVKIVIMEKFKTSMHDPSQSPSASTWSSFLSDFLFYNSRSVAGDKHFEEVEKNFKTKSHYILARYGLSIFLALMILLTLVCFVLVPLMGFLFFRCLAIIWDLVSSRLVRRIGRKIIIRRELRKRKNNRYLLPVIINKKVPKRFFRIPRFFQEYTDEEEPEVLRDFRGTIAVHIKESTSGISIHKIFGEFFKHGKPEDHKIPNYHGNSITGYVIGEKLNKPYKSDEENKSIPIPQKTTRNIGNKKE